MTEKNKLICSMVNEKTCIGFDLDGTLLKNGEWKAGFNSLINKLASKYYVFFATGRSILECNKIICDLNVNIPFICDDGQYIYDLKKRNYTECEYVNVCEADYDFFYNNKIEIAVETDSYIYTESKILKKLLKMYCGVEERAILHGIPKECGKIYKIYYYEKSEDCISELEKGYFITKIEKRFGSLTQRDVNKCTALKKLFNNSCVKIDNTLYFGDGKNDIQLMKAVRISVAVYNAIEELKEVCEYVLDKEEEFKQILFALYENEGKNILKETEEKNEKTTFKVSHYK